MLYIEPSPRVISSNLTGNLSPITNTYSDCGSESDSDYSGRSVSDFGSELDTEFDYVSERSISPPTGWGAGTSKSGKKAPPPPAGWGTGISKKTEKKVRVPPPPPPLYVEGWVKGNIRHGKTVPVWVQPRF